MNLETKIDLTYAIAKLECTKILNRKLSKKRQLLISLLAKVRILNTLWGAIEKIPLLLSQYWKNRDTL